MKSFIIIALAGLFTSTAWSQQTSTQTTSSGTTATTQSTPPSAEPTKTLKKIVITGSYIRRTSDEGAPSPVTSIDATGKAAEAASQTTGDILRDNAIFSGGNVSFHGQSSANNLVLLNGLRLPKPGGGDSATVDFIPATAIERVEVLKDGSSALYGSEALAGVVNIITKKEYDGANISGRYQFSEMVFNAPETTLSGTYGKTFESGNLMAAFQYRGTKPIDYKDTIYGITDVLKQGSFSSSPGNLKKAPGPYFHANDCPAANLTANGACTYDYYKNGLQYTSEQNYYNGLISSGWDLGSKLRLETALVYTYRRAESLGTPIIANFENVVGSTDYSITDAEATAAGWAPFLSGALTPGNYNVLYSPDEELGRRRDINTTQAGAAQVSLGQQLESFDWDLAAGYSLSDSDSDTVEGNANKAIMYQKMIDGSWNPFAPIGTKFGDLNAARIQTWNTNFSDVTNARLIGSGKLINWGDKSVYTAVGIENQYQTYRFRTDPFSLNGVALTGEGSNQDGRRDVFSSFIELTQNPVHRLQLQVAARFDKYSDFGSTVNPKFGAAYKFNDKITIRSSYGTGFKAPDLRSLFQGRLSSPRRFRDQVTCNTNVPGGCNNLYYVTTQGDQNLDAELGKHFNMGLQLRPKKNWQINIDHWRASGENALNGIDLTALTEAEAQFGASVLSDLGVTIVRDPTTKIIQNVITPLRTNSGTYQVNGVDLEIKYRGQFNPMNTGSVNFTFKFDHSHVLDNGSQPFFFDQYRSQRNLNWKNITSLAFSKDKHLVSWRFRTYAGGDFDISNSGVGVGSTSTLTENDLHYEYYGAWNGVITAGIRNIFNALPINTYSRGNPGVSLPAGETQLGRTFYVGYSQDF